MSNKNHYQNTQKNIENKFSLIYLLDSNNGKVHTLKEEISNIITGYNGSTYIIMKDNTFMVYGYNAHGQLGLNHFDYVGELTKCKQFKTRNIFSSISSKHSFCITQKNIIYAVGNNLNNQFGIQNKTINTLNKWNKINPFSSFSLNIKIKSISTSWEYTLFLTQNGEIYETNNKNIKLIKIKNKNKKNINYIKFQSIACGKYHSFTICEHNNIYSWGGNHYGQLGLNNKKLIINTPQKLIFFSENNIKIKKISCGLYHNLVLGFNGKVYCFGSNEYFQLGNGMKYSYLALPQINNTLKYQMIVDIKCGGYHNLVINNKNEYLLWGNNKNNQCLVYDKNNDNYYEYYDQKNINFIKLPTKYKYNKNKMKIINMYTGYKTTFVISTKIYELNKDNTNNIGKNNRKNKLVIKFRKWYKSLKLNNLNESKNVFDLPKNQSNDINRMDEENKYEDDVNEYGQYYIIPTTVNNKGRTIKYSALSLNEC